jgi:hypothetical protein
VTGARCGGVALDLCRLVRQVKQFGKRDAGRSLKKKPAHLRGGPPAFGDKKPLADHFLVALARWYSGRWR